MSLYVPGDLFQIQNSKKENKLKHKQTEILIVNNLVYDGLHQIMLSLRVRNFIENPNLICKKIFI